MSKSRRQSRGATIYLCALCFAICIFGFALGLFGENIGNNQQIYFDSIKVLFGGESGLTRDGYYYGYSFAVNIPLIILMMLMVVGIFSSLTARNSPRSIGVTIVLLVLVLVGLVFLRQIFLGVNNSLTGSGLVFGPGYYVALVSTIVGLVIAIIELCVAISFWRGRDAFR